MNKLSLVAALVATSVSLEAFSFSSFFSQASEKVSNVRTIHELNSQS